MNHHCDIICLSLLRWDAPISSPGLSLAKEFAKQNRVFYIDHPFSWKDYLKEIKSEPVKSRKNALIKGKDIYRHPENFPVGFTVVTPRLTIPVNFLSNGKIYHWLSGINDSIILRAMRKLIHDFEISEFIYINFFDPYFVQKFPPDIQPTCKIYQAMDDIAQVEYSNRHGTRLEEGIIRNFDYTLCTSKELTRVKSAFSNNVFYFPNGADTDLFRKAADTVLEKPRDLVPIQKKIIGYTGSIEYRIDFHLLRKIAEYHQDKILFLIGPAYGEEYLKLKLEKIPNIIFAGERQINELPAYLQYFDCVIIPFKKNTLTKSIYPLKINEYLAAGKPVITTNFSEDIFSFRDVAYIANDENEFLQAVDIAIEEDNSGKKSDRVRRAEQNSWKVRVEQFWKILTREDV